MNVDARFPAARGILRPVRNAWRVVHADQFAFLIDGDAYFEALDRTLRNARRSIIIVGWDFDPDIRLRPAESQETLGELLHGLAERNPDLEIHILVWAMGPIYSGHSLKLFRQQGWSSHPRISLRFDKRHAFRGCHHQKMVTVDGAIAFVGGMDLTAGRWDTSRHPSTSPLRVKPSGEVYGPVHDVQAIFRGPAAHPIIELARRRWKWATGEEINPDARGDVEWPSGITPDIEHAELAVARTVPGLAGLKSRRETIRLTLDAIAAARSSIYIETQYLASFRVCDALARRLREANGPDVAIIVTRSSRGMLEQFVMARNRNRVIRRLKRADRYDRLRVMYAVVPDETGGECEVLIHAKVLVVDDAFARVGSSNLNNRSEGLDTECDVAIEARTPAERLAVARFRNRLLGEHLDADVQSVEQVMRAGSLVAAIDRLNVRPRGLRPIDVDPSGKIAALPGTSLLDPRKPFRPLHVARELVASIIERWRSGSGRRKYSLARKSGTPSASGMKK